MSVRVSKSIRIARSPEDVFTFIATPENFPRWDPAIREVRRTGQGPVHRGSELSVTVEEGGRTVSLDTRVTDFEPGRLFGVSATYSGIPLHLRWRIRPEGDGTLLTSEGEAEVGGFMALASGLIKGMVEERLDRAHHNLKRMLEARS